MYLYYERLGGQRVPPPGKAVRPEACSAPRKVRLVYPSTERTGGDEFVYNRVQPVMWNSGAARATHDGSAMMAHSAVMNTTVHHATVHHAAVVRPSRKVTVTPRPRGAVVISRVRSRKRGEAESIGCR